MNLRRRNVKDSIAQKGGLMFELFRGYPKCLVQSFE